VKATTCRFEWTPAKDSSASPEAIPKYSGLARLVRQEIVATVVPLDAEYVAPQNCANSSSWVRVENGQVVLAALREYRLNDRKGVCHFENLVSTTASVVVASKTADALNRTSKLGLVPYGGEVTLRHKSGVAAEVTEHRFDGKINRRRILLSAGELQLSFREHAEEGAPVEWVGIDFV
jgi:hypothetical protein